LVRKNECHLPGVVVQLVRIPACHAGGRGFEPRPLRQKSHTGQSLNGGCPVCFLEFGIVFGIRFKRVSGAPPGQRCNLPSVLAANLLGFECTDRSSMCRRLQPGRGRSLLRAYRMHLRCSVVESRGRIQDKSASHLCQVFAKCSTRWRQYFRSCSPSSSFRQDFVNALRQLSVKPVH
jgi:hypothetical protein